MPIFNSLGSNYDFSFVLKAAGLGLGLIGADEADNSLENYLQKKHQGQAQLTAKGRDAIQVVLENLGLESGDGVLTQAFSCYAVEQGIKRSGAVPVYVDLAPGKLHFGRTQLEQAFNQAKQAGQKPKAVLVQHSLGYPGSIKEIHRFCLDKGLFLIQDLAQAYGAETNDREPLGHEADALVLSFGRDKIIDAVSGGAAVMRGELAVKSLPEGKERLGKILFYPLLTWLIRYTYCFGLGKLLHLLAKKLGWIKSPVIAPYKSATAMPAKLAPLVLHQLQNLEEQLEHRRKIAHVYYNQLKSVQEIEIPIDQRDITLGSNQRFPLLVPEPNKLLKHLANKGVYLFDRWYRQAVDSGKIGHDSVYRAGACPQAEELAGQIINLPTHINLDLDQALKISNIIKQFYF